MPGIPVILVDNDIPGLGRQDLGVVATDNHAGGVLAGQFMAEQAEPQGDTIAVLEGAAGAPSLDGASMASPKASVTGSTSSPRCQPTATRRRGSMRRGS